MMVAYHVHSHQRGSGVSSSLTPSHSWPVVSTPECSSVSRSDMIRLVFLEGQVGEALERLLVPGPQGVDAAGEEDQAEVDRAALLGELRHGLVGQAGHRRFSGSVAL